MKILMRYITVILLPLLLIGCSLIGDSQKNASQTKKIGKSAKNTILLFKEGRMEEVDYYGDLYIKRFGEAEEKITSNVRESDVFYEQESDIVYFKDEESDLYRFSRDKGNEKLASDIYEFNIKQGKVFYYSGDYSGYDLYIVNDNLETEKIDNFVVADHTQYEIVDTDLYYINSDYDLKSYNIVSQTESLLASDVSEFKILTEKGQLLYEDLEGSIFYGNGTKDALEVSSDSIDFESIQYVNNTIYYISYGEEVLKTELTGSLKTTQLATDVLHFEVLNGKIYYLNNDGNLFVKKEKSAESKKIISGIDAFIIKGNNIFSLKDKDLFKTNLKNTSEKVVLTRGLVHYSLSDSGEIIYMTDDNELYVDTVKLTSDLNGYGIAGDTIIFSTNDRKLYRSDKFEEAIVVEKDLSEYSFITYNNDYAFWNGLTFGDLEGNWETYDFENNWHLGNGDYWWEAEDDVFDGNQEADGDVSIVRHIEFLADNKLRFITDDEEYEATIGSSGFDFIDFELGGYEYLRVFLDKDGSITLWNKNSGISFDFNRVTQKRVDSYLETQVEEEEEAEEAEAEAEAPIQTDTVSANDIEKSLYMESIEYAFELISSAADAPSFTIGLQEAHEAWDNELNRIYGLLKEELSPQKMEALREEQRAWIKSRDEEAGDPAVVGVWTELEIRIDLTKEKTLYLIDMYFAEKE